MKQQQAKLDLAKEQAVDTASRLLDDDVLTAELQQLLDEEKAHDLEIARQEAIKRDLALQAQKDIERIKKDAEDETARQVALANQKAKAAYELLQAKVAELEAAQLAQQQLVAAQQAKLDHLAEQETIRLAAKRKRQEVRASEREATEATTREVEEEIQRQRDVLQATQEKADQQLLKQQELATIRERLALKRKQSSGGSTASSVTSISSSSKSIQVPRSSQQDDRPSNVQRSGPAPGSPEHRPPLLNSATQPVTNITQVADNTASIERHLIQSQPNVERHQSLQEVRPRTPVPDPSTQLHPSSNTPTRTKVHLTQGSSIAQPIQSSKVKIAAHPVSSTKTAPPVRYSQANSLLPVQPTEFSPSGRRRTPLDPSIPLPPVNSQTSSLKQTQLVFNKNQQETRNEKEVVDLLDDDQHSSISNRSSEEGHIETGSIDLADSPSKEPNETTHFYDEHNNRWFPYPTKTSEDVDHPQAAKASARAPVITSLETSSSVSAYAQDTDREWRDLFSDSRATRGVIARYTGSRLSQEDNGRREAQRTEEWEKGQAVIKSVTTCPAYMANPNDYSRAQEYIRTWEEVYGWLRQNNSRFSLGEHDDVLFGLSMIRQCILNTTITLRSSKPNTTGKVSQTPVVIPELQTYLTLEQLDTILQSHLESTHQDSIQSIPSSMDRVAFKYSNQYPLMTKACSRIDARLDDCRHRVVYPRHTNLESLSSIRWMIIDSIFVIKQIFFWLKKQSKSASSKDEFPCAIAHLEVEPHRDQVFDDIKFPSYETVNIDVSPLLNHEHIFSLEQLFTLTSHFNDPDYTEPSCDAETAHRRTNMPEDVRAMINEELSRGNSILLSHRLFIDARYQYLHHLQKIWVNTYARV